MLSICPCRKFVATIPRRFTVRYDPYTQSVDVINSKEGMQALASDIKCNIGTLENAIKNTVHIQKGDDEVRPFALCLLSVRKYLRSNSLIYMPFNLNLPHCTSLIPRPPAWSGNESIISFGQYLLEDEYK